MLNKPVQKNLARGALLFALALVFQGLRMIIPIPPFIGMFLIGTLVNMTLILATWYTGLPSAILMGLLLPFVAFMQGQLAIAPLIPVVAMGNTALVLLIHLFKEKNLIWLIPFFKTLILYGGCMAVIQIFTLPREAAVMISFTMSWPQLITAALGILLARRISGALSLSRS